MLKCLLFLWKFWQYLFCVNILLCLMFLQPFGNWSCNLKNLRNFTFKSSNKKMHHGKILRQGLNDNIIYTYSLCKISAVRYVGPLNSESTRLFIESFPYYKMLFPRKQNTVEVILQIQYCHHDTRHHITKYYDFFYTSKLKLIRQNDLKEKRRVWLHVWQYLINSFCNEGSFAKTYKQ